MLLGHSAKDGVDVQSYSEHVGNVRDLSMSYGNAVSLFILDEGLRSKFLSNLEEAALYHDLGKLHPDNQRDLGLPEKDQAKYLSVPHSDAGAEYLFEKKNIHSSLIVASHHSGLKNVESDVRNHFRHSFDSVRKTNDVHMELMVKLHHGEFPYKEFRTSFNPESPMYYRFLLSCLVHADHLDTSRHYKKNDPYYSEIADRYEIRASDRIDRLDKHISGLQARVPKTRRNELRALVYDRCTNVELSDSGMYSLFGPVGIGKTFSSLRAALEICRKKGSRGIINVLPFTSIIDQNVKVFRNSIVLDGEDPIRSVVAHHSNTEYMGRKLKDYNISWASPIIVTTSVQFYETLHHYRTSPLKKLHEIAGRVIILDESHAHIPPELWKTTLGTMKELVKDWGCSFIFCSGTMFKYWEIKDLVKDMDVSPILDASLESELFAHECGRVDHIDLGCLSSSELIDSIVKDVASGSNVLSCFNTIQTSAVVAKRLVSLLGSDNVLYLSTSLTPKHRKFVLDEIDRRFTSGRVGWVLVSTSCIECGMDFSFPVGYREKYSHNNLLQFSGRVNREHEYSEAKVFSFSLKSENLLTFNNSCSCSVRVLNFYLKSGEISPEHSTAAFTMECREKNLFDKKEFVFENNKKLNYILVKDGYPDDNISGYSVIPMGSIQVLVDPDIANRIRSGLFVRPQEISENCFNILFMKKKSWDEKGLDFLEPLVDDDVEGDEEEGLSVYEKKVRKLYFWKGSYDDLVGYVQHVIDMKSLPFLCV